MCQAHPARNGTYRKDLRVKLRPPPPVLCYCSSEVMYACTECLPRLCAGSTERKDAPRIAEPMEKAGSLSPEDYYIEDGEYVLTASYLLKRGYCCGNICQHCPYGEDIQRAATGGSKRSKD